MGNIFKLVINLGEHIHLEWCHPWVGGQSSLRKKAGESYEEQAQGQLKENKHFVPKLAFGNGASK